ncbi:MAG: hypothetical protein AB1696_29265 [Planctomycetota bacterium]
MKRREIKFLVTVDCDLRTDDVALRQESLDVLLGVFAQTGVSGHATWFLNENDFAITKNHESFLKEALRRGDSLGLHDHVDPFSDDYDKAILRDFCRRSKESVEAWLAANGAPRTIALHRNGCLAQHENIYDVLRELGYPVLSDVYPEHTFPNHKQNLSFDNRHIPVGIPPYRHDAANWQDYRSTAGCFLHIPVMYMFVREWDYGLVDRWLAAFERDGVEDPVLVWLFHPYEIMNKAKTEISPENLAAMRAIIKGMAERYGATFASMDEIVRQVGA